MDKKLQLIQWFEQNKRDLPWREDPLPYAVWVSEIMLQQTQVAVVIPYFLRWMNLFPTISALAEASLDDVIKCWEGLGYYSRARALFAGAKHIVTLHSGELPQTAEELAKIPGIGPYTNGAIRSFAFKQKAAAVDGNVLRVLTRYYGNQSDLSKSANVKSIWAIAETILPEEEPWIFSEALIELGATVCTKSPKCLECPLKESCVAYKKGIASELPFKSAKVQIEKLYRSVAVIQAEDCFLVSRGLQGQIMSDLYEFPYFPLENPVRKDLCNTIKKQFGLAVSFDNSLEEVEHSFTRYRVRLFPDLFTCDRPKEIEGYNWFTMQELSKLAFSSGHRRILDALNKMDMDELD